MAVSNNVIQYAIRAKDETRKGLSAARAGLNKMGTAFGVLGTAAVVAGAAIINSNLKSLDAVTKMSNALGIATEDMVAMRHVAGLTGANVELMGRAIGQMQRFASEATTGSAEYADTLKQLNIEVDDFIKLKPDEQFEQVATAMVGMTNESEKTQIAMDIFGRSGLALKNTLIEVGEKGLQPFREEAEALGISFDAIDARKIEEANDSILRAKSAFQGIFTQLTIQLAPIISNIALKIRDLATAGIDWRKIMTDAVFRVVRAVAFMADAWNGLKVVFKILEVAGRAAFAAILITLDQVNKAVIKFINFIVTGINTPLVAMLELLGKVSDKAKQMAAEIKAFSFVPSNDLTEWAEAAALGLADSTAELAALADAPPPGDGIIKFFQDLTREAEIAATATQRAAAGGGALSSGAGTRDSGFKTFQADLDAHKSFLQDRLVQIQEANMTQNELELEFHAEQVAELESIRAQELLTEEEFHILKEDMERNHLARMGDARALAQKEGLRFLKKNEEEKFAILVKTSSDTLSEVKGASNQLFNLHKGFSLASALISLPSAVVQSFERAGGYPWGIVPAALMAAKGAIQISRIRSAKFSGAAHAGLDNVPEEGTFLLQRGERVIKPEQNRDLTRFLDKTGGGSGAMITVEKVDVHVLENIDDMSAFASMSITEVQEMVADKLFPAMRALENQGLGLQINERGDFLT